MAESVARIAKAAGARCYTDPFVTHAKPVENTNLLARLVG
jgi:3-phenylpropionate/trans-cinnamate dioxygenase ferredoxin reductase subunit